MDKICRVVGVLLCLWVAVGQEAAAAAENTLGDQVSGKVHLTAEELARLEPALAHYYALHGTKLVLRSIVEASAENGCRGECLAEMVTLLARGMKNGQTDSEAGQKVYDALVAVGNLCRERGIEPEAAEVSRTVRARLGSQLPNHLPRTP